MEEKQKEKWMNITFISIVVVVVVLALLLLLDSREVIDIESAREQIVDVIMPKEEPQKEKVVFNCIRANNTSCVIDGTCPRFEQHTFSRDDPDYSHYYEGEFMWYNESWCEIELR